ncbi:MAG: Nif3-like dinuclear metal center hexameric protein [Candidatus Latescibacteria bacterium]|jgi:dinuclear metal center YbgI/SA1388 family protein|nr:Nif3-like dinuclear metal center hexameric protein [Candidatus Latescibacterota bacterium]
MAKVRDVTEVLENWSPLSIAEPWDNVGLITGDPDKKVATVLITLDVTDKTISNAIENQTSLIISHHPPILKPIKNFSGSAMSSRLIREAIKHNISIYALHTNLDQAPEGVSSALAGKLGLSSLSFLAPGTSGMVKFITYTPPEYTDSVREAAGSQGAGIIGEYSLCSFTSRGTGTYIPSSASAPYEGEPGKLSRAEEDRIEMIVSAPFAASVVEAAREAHPYDEMAYDLVPLSNAQMSFGYGAVGNLKEKMGTEQFSEHVSESLGMKILKISKGKSRYIQRVAVMGGSGRSYIDCAISCGAEVYVTGDLGHHDFLDYGESIMLIDASHRATELPVLEKIREQLLMSKWGKEYDITIDPGENVPTVFECHKTS